MKILYVADIHMNLKHLHWLEAQCAHYDLIAICGDILQLAYTSDKPSQIKEVLPILQQIKTQTPIIVVSGNHDGDTKLEDGEEFSSWIPKLNEVGIFADGYTHDSGKYRFTCCPWWNGPEVRRTMVKQIEKDIPEDRAKWIWAHHAPPRGSRIAWTTKGDAGDPFLLKLIGRHKPYMVLAGHIHNAPFYADGGWAEKIDQTWVFNPGKQIGDTPSHIVIDLAEQQATYASMEGIETITLT